jgi:hypothetical protein
VQEDELNEKNLSPVEWLTNASMKYGVKNGVIINNKRLEACIRERFGDKLVYISSCTKYVSPHKLLTPRETKAMYREDIDNYDQVVLTPQDSRREDVVKEAVRFGGEKIVAIANSYCAYGCNSYHHYASMSRENKTSMLKLADWNVLMDGIKFLFPRMSQCSAFRHSITSVNVEKIAGMQIRAGIVNFKLGRGFGVDGFEKLVALIQAYERKTRLDGG